MAQTGLLGTAATPSLVSELVGHSETCWEELWGVSCNTHTQSTGYTLLETLLKRAKSKQKNYRKLSQLQHCKSAAVVGAATTPTNATIIIIVIFNIIIVELFIILSYLYINIPDMSSDITVKKKISL